MQQQISNVLARRSASAQANFLLPHLKVGIAVLDCGCGPGTITCDLARNVTPGSVVGIDSSPEMVAQATAHAGASGITNASFQAASVYDLPFENSRFQIVFAYALFQHLAEPQQAMSEMRRVLAPGGILALRSPDWGGILIAPRTPALLAAIGTFLSAHYNNGDAFAGSNGPGLANMGGFSDIVFSASVEREHPAELGPFAAGKLTASLCAAEIACLLTWANDPKALFAQTWGEVVARRAD